MENEPFKIRGFQVYRKDRDAQTAWGGVAILIRRYIEHNLIPEIQFRHLEVIGIQIIQNNNIAVNILSIYRQPNKPLLEEDISNIFNNQNVTLAIGDFNCKNTLWGCRKSNPNGEKLQPMTSKFAFQVTAPEEVTYIPYQHNRQPDILDIILQKNYNMPIFQTVLMDLDSDHLPVIISANNVIKTKPPPPRLINGKINWNEFQRQLNSDLKIKTRLENEVDIDQTIENITLTITKNIREATYAAPHRKVQRQTIPKYIYLLIHERNKLRRVWKNTRNPTIKNQLNSLTHRIKKEIDKHRFSAYQKHLEQIEVGDNELWKMTKRILKQPEIIHNIHHENTTYLTDEEKCTVFANHLERTFRPTIYNYNFTRIIENYVETHQPIADTSFNPITPLELKEIIRTLPTKKAPGHDLITNIVLKHLTPKTLAYLSTIFNRCLSIGYFPLKWKIAHIIVFLKPGKNKNEVTSYRPISLLTTMSKILEKCIKTRLELQIHEKNILPPIQYGFRQGHSTNHQLLRLTETIEKGFDRKQYTAVTFLDLQQAFDKVWLTGLKYKLIKLNLPQYLTAIIYSFLNNRTFAVRINNTISENKEIQAGVPQGSILGPSLFNIYLYDIPNPTDTTLTMFADDTAITTQHTDINEATQQLQKSVSEIYNWLTKWCININYQKCEAKIFTLRKIESPNEVIIGTHTIPWKQKNEAVKYLGVYLDTRLSWKFHINKKLNQCYSRLGQLYSLMNRKSSLKTKCTLLLYKSLIRPIITYACCNWCTTSKTNYKKIQTLQNKVLRIAVNAPWFVRNTQLHNELKIPTINQTVKKLTKNFLNNLNNCDSAVYHELGHKGIHTRLKRKLPQDVCSSVSDNSGDSD